MRAFIINLSLAIVWMLLNKSANLFNFLLGFFIGFLLLAIFPGLLSSRNYTRRILGFFRFLFVFLFAFIKANLSVASIILFVRVSKMKPSLFTYDASDMTYIEILLLSHCITLTPGTITVELSDDRKMLTVHCLDYRNPKQVHDSITTSLKNSILRFTR